MKDNKQNKPTFADRARALQNKYKKAAWDKLEADELEAEMEKLQAEQEAVREMMGMNQQEQPMQEFGNGGRMMYANGTDDEGIPETVTRDYSSNYPSWLPTWAGNTLDFLGNVDRLGSNNARDLITGIAPVPGRGFKGGYRNLPVNTKLPKQTFSTARNVVGSKPNITTGATAAEKLAAKEAETMNKLVNAPGGLSKQFPFGTEKTIMDELVNAPGSLAKQFPNGATNLGQKAGRGVVSQAQIPYTTPQRPVGYLDNIADEITGNINMGYNFPWKSIGYGAAGIGGAGLLGAGIYGLTQLPDGTVVDKSGTPVSQAQIDAMSGANPSISKAAGFQPTQEWLNSIGWNSKLPTEQQIKSNIKGGKNTTIAQQSNTPAAQQQMNLDPSGWNNVVDNINNLGMMASPQVNGATINPQQASALNSERATQIIQNLQNELNPTNTKNKGQFWNNNKQYLPYALSGISNIAGNLLLAAMAKKNTPHINPSLVTPEKMNLEPQAEQLRKDALVSKNIGMKQARDLGLNAGATLANMGAIGSGVDRQLGANLTNLYGQQEQFNTNAANQFALQNQEAINRSNMFNAQYQGQANQDKLNYLSGALGTIPGVMKDVRMDNADKEMRSIMDSYYKSSGGKNYLAVGSIFDTEFGKYVVKGHNPDGTPITEKVKK